MLARRLCTLILLASLLVSLAPSPGASADLTYRRGQLPEQALDPPIATANGQPVVNRRDFNQGLSVLYFHTMQEVHRRQMDWLRWLIGYQLLAGTAIRRGVSVEELLRAELKASPEDPARWEAARAAYVQRLWDEAKVTISLPEPARPLVQVSEASQGAVLGLQDAPITVIEFCSFTSPECRAAWKLLHQAVKKYGYRLRIAHRDFPEPDRPASMAAALAGRCALRQKKFWPYHDLLYANQERLAEPGTFKRLAAEVGLDTAEFGRCLDGRETAQEVAWDVVEAQRVSLSRRPSLFINLLYVDGVLPFDELCRLMDSVALQ